MRQFWVNEIIAWSDLETRKGKAVRSTSDWEVYAFDSFFLTVTYLFNFLKHQSTLLGIWIETIHKLHFSQKPVPWFLGQIFFFYSKFASLSGVVVPLHTFLPLFVYNLSFQHGRRAPSYNTVWRRFPSLIGGWKEGWFQSWNLGDFAAVHTYSFIFASLLEATPDCSLNPPTLLSKLIRHTIPCMSTLILEFPSIVARCICVSLLLLGGR